MRGPSHSECQPCRLPVGGEIDRAMRSNSMHPRLLLALGSAIAFTALPLASVLRAQQPELQPTGGSGCYGRGPRCVDDTPGRSTARWIAPTLVLGAALVGDERIRPIALANRSPFLNRVAGGADILGTAGHIVPALALTYTGARISGKTSFAAATLRVALSYVAADAIEAALKPMVGRARPDLGREPLTFRPFSMNGGFQSFPSAHEVHIASLATAVA